MCGPRSPEWGAWRGAWSLVCTSSSCFRLVDARLVLPLPSSASCSCLCTLLHGFVCFHGFGLRLQPGESPAPSPKHSVMSSDLRCPQTTWIPSPAPNCSLTPDVPSSPCPAELPWCFLCDTSQTVTGQYHKVESSLFDLSHSYASCETQPRHHLLWEAFQG